MPTDGVNVLRAAAGLSGDCPVARCDVDGDGNVTVTDGVNVIRAAAGLPVNLSCAPEERFVDNGDGTVTDNQTGLQWEKKTTAAGSGENFADPHDVDNTYSWCLGANLDFMCDKTGNPPDGSAFTHFLAALNTPPCFAGHCDWRLPSEAGQNSPFTGAQELESILLAAYPCGTSPCIAPIFGPTAAFNYSSSTTQAGFPSYAWNVSFSDGHVSSHFKNTSWYYVRAVRAGS